MIDELMIAFVASLVFSCVVFFPLKLSGLWVLFLDDLLLHTQHRHW